ncbi:7-cyano-7-deazaguanine synthase [Arenibacter sp. F26102]|uniref:7-cyano-7-deazaguanine synthase n=1 Tax=Arenibacter sp. F26102 TaxID=2926416 RepID=UPI00248B1631|nr:7-cyano-7-deazaguanine synthase [Arenibacter sp. F26102]
MSIILSLTSSIALHRGINKILWGNTSDDGVEKFEYTTKFSVGFSKILNESEPDKKDIEIIMPIANKRKWEGFMEFKDNPALFSLTWSCITERQTQCGKCGACIARRLAAKLGGIEDTTKYRSKEFDNPLSIKQMNNPKNIPLGSVFKSPRGPE